jgi:xanthosine utilization system XapX-like protein
MAAINTGRWIGGGLLAGLIINIVETIMNMFVIADDWKAVYDNMGMTEPGGAAIGEYIVLAFVLGLLISWVYAAIRPRFGAGPGTAFKAGVAVWVGANVFPTLGWMIMGGVPTNLAIITLVYTFVEVVVAALAAGAVYQEGGAPAM